VTHRLPPSGGAGSRLSRAAGVTLVELLVVLALIGVLMGIGISMYANLGKQSVFSASVTRVLSAINRVRNSSVTHPAALQLTAGSAEKGDLSSIRGIEFVTMFQSQCEPLSAENNEVLVGAYGRDGRLTPGAEFRDGVIGKALFVRGAAVNCGNYSAYDATDGVAVDLWVFPEGNQGGTLVSRGSGLSLSLLRRGTGLGIRFDLAFAAGTEDASTATASTIAITRSFEPKDFVLPPNRWTRIRASYDRSAVVLAVDQGRGPVERFRQPERGALMPTREAELFLAGGGGAGASFLGGIDDVRIEGVLGENPEPLPHPIEILGRSRRIWFLGGKLDPAHHSRPETIILKSGKREREVVIGTEGTILQK